MPNDKALSPADAAKAGLQAVGIWVAIELVVRVVLIAAIAGILVQRGRLPDDFQTASRLFLGPAVAGGLLVSMAILAHVFRRRARMEGLSLGDLGYRFEGRTLIAGLASGVLVMALAWGAGQIDQYLFAELERVSELLMRLLAAAGPGTAVGFLLGNGILGPVVEEFAWRGYIQHRFSQAWGRRTGLLVTAVLFAVKHMVVDVSLGRITILLVAAFALGLIRQRWGTAASTASHLTMNLFATAHTIVATR